MNIKNNKITIVEEFDLHHQNRLYQLIQDYKINNNHDNLKGISKYQVDEILKNQNLDNENLFVELKNELGKTPELVLLKRQSKSKCDPITKEIYQLILSEIPGNNYIKIRLRLTFCLLLVTKLRISDLLLLKMDQLEKLLNLGWIIIEKKSLTQIYEHNIFLTIKETKILENQRKDIELFLQWTENIFLN